MFFHKNLMISAIFFGVFAILSAAVEAQEKSPTGECTDGLCGAPQPSPGGGNKNDNVLVVSGTDHGEKFFFADDDDLDGLEDDFDNCPFVFNPDQANQDGDKFGDACDVCPGKVNVKQFDMDGDKIGDECDQDMDGDRVPNDIDNCRFIPNPAQRDYNVDGVGDVCDINQYTAAHDEDGDGIPNIDDNCPGHYNPAQLDTNGERGGDACDEDLDGDGILNHLDNCRDVHNASQRDADRDLLGDECDPHFCLIVNPNKPLDCLDPKAPFTVRTGPDRSAQTGQKVYLRIFANRENALIETTWIVWETPDGSRAVVSNPRGSSDVSRDFEYAINKSHPTTFTPDMPGRYRLRVVAVSPYLSLSSLQVEDRIIAQADLVIVATGEPVLPDGCATTPAAPNRAAIPAVLMRR